MKNFQLISVGLDILPLQLTLKRKDHLFGAHPGRTGYPESVHGDVQDILLRINNSEDFQTANFDPESPDQAVYSELPEARSLVNWLVARVQAERIGRVMITKLAPGKGIKPHIDFIGENDYCSYYDRFHIAIQSASGMQFYADPETVEMHTGECWWFNNKALHWVQNHSDIDRIHMVIDLRLRQ